jgi:hypothetical protein
LACTRRSTPRWRSRRSSQSWTGCKGRGGKAPAGYRSSTCSTLLGIARLTRRFSHFGADPGESVPFAFAITEVTSFGNVLLLYLFAFAPR